MNKLYERIDFVNDAAPDLNAANLNRMSKGLDDVDTRLSEIIPADDYAELAEETKENAEKARIAADNAEAIVGIGIATTERAGIVKPDGTTTLVDEDGTIHCVNTDDYDAELSETSENAPQNKVVTEALDNINVYVGDDGKIHFTDRTGADSALPFNRGIDFSVLPEFQQKTEAKGKTVTFTFVDNPSVVIINVTRTTSLNLDYIYTIVLDMKHRVSLVQKGSETIREDATIVTNWADNAFTIKSWSSSYDYRFSALAYYE